MQPTLIQQNRRLKQIMQKCEQQIIELKKIGHDHEQEIDNLLKFNERLLSIIENQMPNKSLSRNSSGSNLHPIEEGNEKEVGEVVQLQPHRFTHQQHPLKDQVEHVDVHEIQRMSEENQDQYRKHVNGPSSISINSNPQKNQNNQSNPSNKPPASNQSIKPNPNPHPPSPPPLTLPPNPLPHPNQPSSSRQSSQSNVIYRQQKQSLIQIPKLFKLQKGLNDHYHKQLFQSIEEHKKPSALSKYNSAAIKENRKESLPSEPSVLMNNNKISEAVTERVNFTCQEMAEELESISHLIHQYKQDFNTQEYLHLCHIIKNDLQNDLHQLNDIEAESAKFYQAKEKELTRVRKELGAFSPVQKLVEIIRQLKVSEETEEIIVDKIVKEKKQKDNRGVTNNSNTHEYQESQNYSNNGSKKTLNVNNSSRQNFNNEKKQDTNTGINKRNLPQCSSKTNIQQSLGGSNKNMPEQVWSNAPKGIGTNFLPMNRR